MSDVNETTSNPELGRVRAFLRKVSSEAAQKDEAVTVAQRTIAELDHRLDETRTELEKRTAELERAKREHDEHDRALGERVTALTERVLDERLATQLEELKRQLTSEYDERLRTLEAARAAAQAAADQAASELEGLRRDLAATRRTLDEERARRREEREQILADERARSAAELEQLRDRQRLELEALQKAHKATLDETLAQHSKNFERFEAAARDRDQLLVKAQETIAALERDIARARDNEQRERAGAETLRTANATQQARLAEMEDRLRREVEAAVASQRATYQQASAGSEKAVRDLEAALREKAELVRTANEVKNSLERELERLRQAAAHERAALLEKHAAAVEQLEGALSAAESTRAALDKRVEELQTRAAESSNSKRLEELESLKRRLEATTKEQEKLLEAHVKSLTAVKELCSRSAAARSILGGAGDLKEIFAPLGKS